MSPAPDVYGTWRGRCTICFVLLLLALLLYFGHEYRNFGFIFWTTAVFLASLQWIALSRWKRKSDLFKYTDYIYYLAIALVVGVGSRYLDQRPIIEKFNAKIEAARLRDNDIPTLSAEISAMERAERDARERLRLVNLFEGPYLVLPKYCFPPRTGSTLLDGQPNMETDSFNAACLVFHQAIYGKNMLQAEIANVEKNLKLAVQRLSDLSNRYKNADRKAKERISPATMPDEMLFIFIPAVLIVGTMVKLGKTTAALFP